VVCVCGVCIHVWGRLCLAELEAPGAFRRPLQGSCGTFFHFSSALFLNLLTIVKCLYAGLCLPPELI